MKTLTVRHFHKLCDIVSQKCANPYAKAYAEAGLGLSDPHECYVQSLYILNNLSSWRGELAKPVREGFKLFVKENRP